MGHLQRVCGLQVGTGGGGRERSQTDGIAWEGKVEDGSGVQGGCLEGGCAPGSHCGEEGALD